MSQKRRIFLKQGGLTALGLGLIGLGACNNSGEEKQSKAAEQKNPAPVKTSARDFQVSLNQGSLRQSFLSRTLHPIDFPATAKNEFGIDAVEYDNRFFLQRGRDEPFLNELKKRASDNGVKSILLKIGGMGPLAHPDNNIRQEAIQNHYQWVEAAYLLGCDSVGVVLEGEGTPEDMGHAGLDGLVTLSDFAKDFGINILAENQDGNSSNARWLMDVIGRTRMPNCGSLPNFGHFCIQKKNDTCQQEYDKYKGIKELLPSAKALCARSYDFGPDGQETSIDFKRMMQLVKDSAYRGYVGIEYAGNNLPEAEGILAGKKLLEKVFKELE